MESILLNKKNPIQVRRFFDGDEIPKYNEDNPLEYRFSGKRIKKRII